MMSLPVKLPGPMFLLGISVSGPMFLTGGLCQGRPLWAETPIDCDCDCSCYCSNQASLRIRTRGKAGSSELGKDQ